jgi:hypothetical protein
MKVCLYPSLSYPACKSHLFYAELYYHLLSLWLYHVFPHLMNGTIFGKTFIEHKMCVSLNYTNFTSNISHSEKSSAR